jgi:hypothetical protein
MAKRFVSQGEMGGSRLSASSRPEAERSNRTPVLVCGAAKRAAS